MTDIVRLMWSKPTLVPGINRSFLGGIAWTARGYRRRALLGETWRLILVHEGWLSGTLLGRKADERDLVGVCCRKMGNSVLQKVMGGGDTSVGATGYDNLLGGSL